MNSKNTDSGISLATGFGGRQQNSRFWKQKLIFCITKEFFKLKCSTDRGFGVLGFWGFGV